jgi:hypothetical protein
MTEERPLIALVESYDSGEITRAEFQNRVRQLPTDPILRIAYLLRDGLPGRRAHWQSNTSAVVDS